MEKLKSKLILKTRQGKFVRINANGNDRIHLTSIYGCQISLELLKFSASRFTFISDDYYNQYRTELFSQDREKHRFIAFLKELQLPDFFLVNRIDNGKKIYFH